MAITKTILKIKTKPQIATEYSCLATTNYQCHESAAAAADIQVKMK
jgi:hypothetical protein